MVIKLTQNEVMNIPDVFWLPLKRLRDKMQAIYVKDGTDLGTLEYELYDVDMQHNINMACLNYLHSTDWYIIRFHETGVAIPNEVLIGRDISRGAIL